MRLRRACAWSRKDISLMFLQIRSNCLHAPLPIHLSSRTKYAWLLVCRDSIDCLYRPACLQAKEVRQDKRFPPCAPIALRHTVCSRYPSSKRTFVDRAGTAVSRGFSFLSKRLTPCLSPADGTMSIHDKKPKKAQKDEDEDDKAFKLKQQAGKERASASDTISLVH